MLNLPYCHADPFPEEPTGIEGTDAKGKAYGGRFTRQPGDKDYEDYKDKPMRHDKTIERNTRNKVPRRGHIRKVVIRCKVPAPPLAFCKRHPVCKPRINKLHVPVTTTYLEECAEGRGR